MRKLQREATLEILVGLFMFAVLIALGVFTIVLGQKNLFQKTYRYEFIFNEVGGLREGENVYLRGMNVGRVRQIDLENSRVFVYVDLDVPLTLREGYKIEVVNASMLGGRNLKVYEGPPDAETLGEHVTILGSQPIDMIETLSETINSTQRMINGLRQGKGTLGKLLTDDTMYNNLNAIAADLTRVIGRLEAGEGTIGRLLVDPTLHEDLSEMVASLKVVSESLAEGKGTMGKLIVEDTMYAELKRVVGNLNQITDRMNNGEGMLGKLLAADDQLYQDLSETAASLRTITTHVEQGEGTLGKLLQDGHLYDEATLMMEDVRAAIDDWREASPVATFGSVLFGAF